MRFYDVAGKKLNDGDVRSSAIIYRAAHSLTGYDSWQRFDWFRLCSELHFQTVLGLGQVYTDMPKGDRPGVSRLDQQWQVTIPEPIFRPHVLPPQPHRSKTPLHASPAAVMTRSLLLRRSLISTPDS